MCVCACVCGNSHVCVGIPIGTGFSVPNLSKPVKGRAALPPLRSVPGPCSAYVCTSAHYELFRSAMPGSTLLFQPCPMQLPHRDLKGATRRPLNYSRRDIAVTPVRHRAPRPCALEREPYPCVIGVAWWAAIMPHIPLFDAEVAWAAIPPTHAHFPGNLARRTSAAATHSWLLRPGLLASKTPVSLAPISAPLWEGPPAPSTPSTNVMATLFSAPNAPLVGRLDAHRPHVLGDSPSREGHSAGL